MTIYWVEESPMKYTAFHELREREQIQVIDGIGKCLVMYNKLGYPMGAVKIVGEQSFEPSLAEVKE